MGFFSDSLNACLKLFGGLLLTVLGSILNHFDTVGDGGFTVFVKLII